ncbi:MtnX-like HAD-IB family phosphatase [Bacillus marinisedimentorum]|uniref:MtnX-like HAD-IB family phosphatase n=1 Tax=Bacillus marinisedimentorum TaxID=1821260 RepID=UPI0008721543|nr:MtnX-like HAD-IB family phosphatase [Bacillus marinisedimentorum]
MKKWAFVSDFDGTISKKDFYMLVIEKYYPEGRGLFQKWKSGEMKDIDFLRNVFSSIGQNEEQIKKDIAAMPIDEHVPSFIEKVQENGGDFYILSAGTDYYIHHILKEYGIRNVKVFSNEGYFHDNSVHLNIDENDWYYSERYGIDKSVVIKKLKEEYDTIFFIGDSEPDSHPAVHTDLTFAKEGLQGLLREKDVPFVAVDDFKEVEDYLIKEGMIAG